MILSEMKVILTASTAAFAKAMDKASDKLKKWRKGARGAGAAMKKIGGALKGMATIALKAGAALAGIAWGAKKVFDLGASIEETGSKYRTVFGPEASAEVSAFLDNFAAKAGLTTNEAKALVSTTGAIAQGLGFTQKASGQAAIAITKLAGDLSSFNNIPTAETLHAISSALTGEREQLKALGIVVQEADVQAKAFAQTGKTVAKSLTQQEKATATLALITEKAGSAVGDLNRTQGSAANVAKRLGARFKEVRDAVSSALMPAFRDVLKGLEDNEGKFIQMKTWITENTALISAWATVFIESLKLIGSSLVYMWRYLKNSAEIMGNFIMIAYKFVSMDWEGVKEHWGEMRSNLEDLDKATENLTGQVINVGDAIRIAMEGGVKSAKETAEAMGGIKTALDGVNGDGPLDPTIKAAETLDKKLKDLTETFSKNFVNRMVDAAQGGKDAFSGYFAYMKKQLLALAMKALVFRAIMGLGKAWGIDIDKVGKFATSMTSISPATESDGGAGTPLLSGRAASVAPRGMIVNQNIHFEVSAIDGRSATRFIQEQSGAIAGIIATAAKDSTAYRRQLQGA